VDHTGACILEMARPHIYIVASPQSANSLHKQETREGDAGCLANLAFSHMVLGNQ
jgi:hypothetical protein